jgi:LmbE family N-acetylglucosaminyl deacetylase
MRVFDPPGPVLVISTHLDDAVLSCAQFIHSQSDTTVVTVFAGAPRAIHKGWNSATTGEAYAPNAMQKRRSEDAKALMKLGARSESLDFEEDEYLKRRRSDRELAEIQDSIQATIQRTRPSSILSPLGLYHVDHLDVSNICSEILRRATCKWFLYMDLPYGFADPTAVTQKLEAMPREIELEQLAPFSGDPQIKDQTMRLYATQYGPTKKSHRKGFRATMRGAETYWEVLNVAQ